MRQKGRKRPGRQDSVSIAGTSQLENTGTFTKNDYFSDVNPRSMRRLLNIDGFVNYKKGCTRLAEASDKVYQLLAHGP
jgi:hypothetical protein